MAIYVVFGKPRSGKTSYLAYLALINHKKQVFREKFPFLKKLDNVPVLKNLVKCYDTVFCTDNEQIKYTVPFSVADTGKFKPPVNSLFLFCEAGVLFNNRNWKKLSDDAKDFFARSLGHNKCDAWLDSQTVDIDITIRERAEKFFVCRKSWIPHTSYIYKIKFDIDANDDTKKIEEIYERKKGLLAFIFGRLFGDIKKLKRKQTYPLFNSYSDSKSYKMLPPLSE